MLVERGAKNEQYSVVNSSIRVPVSVIVVAVIVYITTRRRNKKNKKTYLTLPFGLEYL
jgi:hypothetical protein